MVLLPDEGRATANAVKRGDANHIGNAERVLQEDASIIKKAWRQLHREALLDLAGCQ
jgi:hypothetical protein